MVDRFDGPPEMQPYVNGDYVRYSDYAELEAENKRLTKDAESYRDIAARKSNQVADMIRAETLSRTGAVKVKALEWEDREERRLGATTEKFWRAQTAFDWGYRVKSYGKGFSFGDAESYPTVDAAKAAAQADYERRILSALEPPAPESQQDDDRIRREMDEILRRQSERDIPFAPATRPSEQAVTDEMVDAACEAFGLHERKHGLDHRQAGMREALKAAMEAGRHD